MLKCRSAHQIRWSGVASLPSSCSSLAFSPIISFPTSDCIVSGSRGIGPLSPLTFGEDSCLLSMRKDVACPHLTRKAAKFAINIHSCHFQCESGRDWRWPHTHARRARSLRYPFSPRSVLRHRDNSSRPPWPATRGGGGGGTEEWNGVDVKTVRSPGQAEPNRLSDCLSK